MSTPTPVTNPQNPQVLRPGPGSVKLIEKRTWLDEAYRLQHLPESAVIEVDAHKAVVRSLCEYLQNIEIESGGKIYFFKKAMHEWSDPEDQTSYPALVVQPITEGTYTGSVSPNVRPKPIVPGSNDYLMKTDDFTQELGITVYSASPKERMALMGAIEQQLSPVDWMKGFKLWMPFYMGQLCSFVRLRQMYSDDEASASRKQRSAHIIVQATLSVMSVKLFKRGPVRLALELDGQPV